jgi:hypothetical protein
MAWRGFWLSAQFAQYKQGLGVCFMRTVACLHIQSVTVYLFRALYANRCEFQIISVM